MAVVKSEIAKPNPIMPLTRKETDTYNRAERNLASNDSQPRDGEIYIWGNKKVVFTTYGVVLITLKRP